MGRSVESQERTKSVAFPERLDDWIHEDGKVRVIDVFVDELDLIALADRSCYEGCEILECERPQVRTAMSLQVLAYNLKRAIEILGAGPPMAAMEA